MLGIKLICVGKVKEKYYIDAIAEYSKRLGAMCRFEITELSESRLSDSPSEKEIEAALEKESRDIEKAIPAGAYVVAMCIEGRLMSSTEMAELLSNCAGQGKSRICFIIGGSVGMHERIKAMSDVRISMSKMTFPHHLARVMLTEQIYRGFMINEGTKYHK